ncbi:TOBE domain-containing protein [Desulfitobacterium metallireducens]|uniref:Molybdenum-pterin-binding protein n=1 Tax=Desulfitobacterium metallireducens DSM 15288 TaxID=871968 RepID=W0E647_9FIRM|nr:TOBE domain-containing protein [Desulfitobacterium metallireducens]AHF06202.1 molybdenum-pterin-binding protein [Desulfitobacterium metallireducens DSM 15288]
MQLSARNQLKGKIKDIKKGPVSTEVVLDINGQSVVASITSTSADSLGLKVGDDAVAIVKASSVMIGVQ